MVHREAKFVKVFRVLPWPTAVFGFMQHTKPDPFTLPAGLGADVERVYWLKNNAEFTRYAIQHQLVD